MTISDLVKNAHTNAKTKGFHDSPKNNGEMIALMHSELSEALEELRNGRAPNEVCYPEGKPEGVPIELADVVIRIADFCGLHEIDLEDSIRRKMEYNRHRLPMHGKKF